MTKKVKKTTSKKHYGVGSDGFLLIPEYPRLPDGRLGCPIEDVENAENPGAFIDALMHQAGAYDGRVPPLRDIEGDLVEVVAMTPEEAEEHYRRLGLHPLTSATSNSGK
jgi:hypothetical protein